MINRKKIVDQLDKAISKIVRARDKICVTCGSDYRPGCGHVFSRGSYSTRWDLTNCFQQCWPCNAKHKFDTVPYYSWYKKTFGQEAFDTLYRKFKTTVRYTNVQLVELLQKLYDDNEEVLRGKS